MTRTGCDQHCVLIKCANATISPPSSSAKTSVTVADNELDVVLSSVSFNPFLDLLTSVVDGTIGNNYIIHAGTELLDGV